VPRCFSPCVPVARINPHVGKCYLYAHNREAPFSAYLDSALFEPFDEEWSSTTRSIRIDGTVTSVRLENFFWRVLGDVANEEGLQVPQLLTRLSKISRSGETTHSNFTSFIRVCCGRYIDRKLNNQNPVMENGADQTPSVQMER